MKNQLHPSLKIVLIVLIAFLPAKFVFGQAEFKPWGNLEGIRIKGQLMDFNTRLVVVGQDWKKISFTAKEKQKPKYTRAEGQATVNTWIGALEFTETAKDAGSGTVVISLSCAAGQDTTVNGVYLNVSVPEATFGSGVVRLDGKVRSFDHAHTTTDSIYFQAAAARITIAASGRQIDIRQDSARTVLARADRQKKFIRYYLPICSGRLVKGQVYTRSYRIQVSGPIDESPATLKLDADILGRPFAGLGGNFRIQNPQDPQVIDYCLQNLRVAWGRVEMPWSSWQPELSADPASLDTAKQDVRVRKAMEMAARLSRMNIPLVLTAWFPPAWAAEGKLNFGPTPQGIWGNPLNRTNMPQIYQSITSYLVYLKKYYGVEAQQFSFNESDLGINVRQTPQEHAELIRGLGAAFASAGLKTKLLLGDNSDATTYRFIYPAMNDPQARPYIGMISFHSWRGWDIPTLEKWADAALKTGLPLIVGEGSIDAAAWSYPAYFQDPSYALEEINLYVRLLAICQPLSILQWQLTADYSPLKGGGIFGESGPLEPTQRFWNLKQLAMTPEGLQHMPIACDKAEISCAALGDKAKHRYSIHLVNNGAARVVHLKGLPLGLKGFRMFVTDKDRAASEVKTIRVNNGQGDFTLGERCYTTLVSL